MLVFAPTQCIENTLIKWTRTTLVLTSVTSCSSDHKFPTNIRNSTVTTTNSITFKILMVLVIINCYLAMLIDSNCIHDRVWSGYTYIEY